MAVRDVVQAAAGVGGGAGELANAIDFDGTSDYLSKFFTAGTFGASSKTFTFSAWFYWNGSDSDTIFQTPTFVVSYNVPAGNVLTFSGYSDTYSTILGWDSVTTISKNSWNHVLISIDLNNSSNRYVYINDVLVSGNYNSYVNSAIGFSQAGTATVSSSSAPWAGRLSNVFLDTTYRDLSVVANRRLFITDDLKPADGQADLNPIIYLPLDDPEDIGNNAGTNGDFTVNGVMARSGRGPNQDNCVASYFDGSSDNLYRAGNYGADSKTLTISFCYSSTTANKQLFNSEIASGDDNIYVLTTSGTGGLQIGTLLNNASNYAVVVNIPSTVVTHNSTHAISVSFDSSDTSKRHVFVDGVDKTASVTWNYYNLNSFVGFSATSRTRLGAGWSSGSNSFHQGNLGEFYLSKDYTDLASDNPFWDSDLNKPIPIRKVLADTGNTPLIAMPIEASNAGLNLGTSGNFTVNSGPYTGARGASEFLARSAKFNGTDTHLSRTDNVGFASSKMITVVLALKKVNTTNKYLFKFFANGPTYETFEFKDVGGDIGITIQKGDGSEVLSGQTDSSFVTANNWHILLFSVDTTSTSKRHFYLDGAIPSTVNWRTYANTAAQLNNIYIADIGADEGGDLYSGDLSNLYIVQDYIDFSQEANRLKFVDGLGYPRDLTQQIEDGDIPTPLVYMKFDDTSALGTNSGTGGDFTINGTVTSGADVSV